MRWLRGKRHLPPSLKTCIPSLRPTWWNKRTNSSKLCTHECTHTEKDRHTDIYTHTQKKERDAQTETQRDTDTNTDTHKDRHRQTDTQREIHTDTGRHRYTHTKTETDRQKYTHRDTDTNIHTKTETHIQKYTQQIHTQTQRWINGITRNSSMSHTCQANPLIVSYLQNLTFTLYSKTGSKLLGLALKFLL